MAWTYTGTPATVQRDAVRFLIGDTDATDQLLADAEVDFLITTHGSTFRAASESARAVAAKYARLMDRSIGGMSASFSSKYNQYLALATNLASLDVATPVSPYLSGYSISAKEAIETDSDRETLIARKGIHDNLRSGPADSYDGYRRAG